ncbi:luciferin sulfotransferase isoform X1 [Nilaparvata lugens]|uniref:luciferin sulfotransferase isoform X2 n=2 Tax=Nilaparvata lugens TaxID=108931 RepID=UPI000B98B85F|nr:luciferin sulfotransferase isoform X2 [Nilaparvata lugens]XP_039280328.1 luciferin sulfotransferase isoform X1 [Nilaparvata lugens]
MKPINKMPVARRLQPIRVETLGDSLSEKLRLSCKPGLMPMGGVRVFPSGCVMPTEYVPYAERLRHFSVRPDDVWVISYPKCGTTWTQEMVWLIGNDCDYEAAKSQLLLQRFPFLEAVSIISQEIEGEEDDENVLGADTITFTEELPSPRFIKTHLTTKLLPQEIWIKKPKIIYVTRDPKDAATSYYHHHRLWNGYTGSYDTFMEGFLKDKLVYSPFWDHVIEYKKLENEPHVLINSYEEMKRDLPGVIRRTAKFLEKDLTDEQVSKLAHHLSFKEMKVNSAINGEEFIKEVKEKHEMPAEDPELTFIRKGEVGGYKNEMPEKLVERFDDWTREKLYGTILQNEIM